MAIAFDAVTAASIAGDNNFNHTPVGTPRAVMVLVAQDTAQDGITGITYGGSALSEVSGSPFLSTLLDEPKTLYGYFLGSGIPTGLQNVAITTSHTDTKRVVVVTATAAADTTIDATQTYAVTTADPSFTLATTASTTTLVLAICASGLGNAANISPGTGFTEVDELDMGLWVSSCERRTSNPTGGDVTIAWTATIEEQYAFAVAIKEAPSTRSPGHRYIKSQAVQRSTRW